MQTQPGVLPLRREQIRPAAAALARAFDPDPLMRYYLPGEPDRIRYLPGLMTVALRYCLLYGEVHTTPGLAGAACWLPPGRAGMTFWGMLRAAWGAVSLGFAWLAFRRLLEVTPVVERLHAGCAPMPHWYLMLLGVDPPCQGRGIGGQLIAPVLERAAQAGLPCYLETMTARDVAFYSKHGFHVAREVALPPSGLTVWAMLRPPS